MTRRWIGLGLALCPGVLCGCAPLLALVGRPKVVSVRPRVEAIDFEGVQLTVRLEVRNPYPVRLRTPVARYTLDIQGTEFLRSEAPVAVDLPARQVGTIRLPVRLSYSGLWSTYRSLRELTEAGYRVRGTLRVAAFGQSLDLPFSHEDKVPILHRPRFSDLSLRVSEASLRGLELVVDAHVANPNAFAIDIRDIGYVVKVGDAQVGGFTASSEGLIPAGGEGRLSLSARLSASSILARIVQGEGLRDAKLCPSGSILTPYGSVHLEP